MRTGATTTTLAAVGLVTLVVVGALGACSDDGDGASASTSSSSPPTVAAGPVAATELVVGDCLTGLVVGGAERIEIDRAQVVGCDQPHELEVFATFDLAAVDFELADESYPGEQQVVDASDDGCNERFASLGDAAETLGLLAVWPTAVSWAGGDRSVACAAYPLDGVPFDAGDTVDR